MTQDDFNEVAWAGFIKFALNDHDMQMAYERDTKDARDHWSPEYVAAFVNWATVNHWGVECAPKKWREMHEGKR